MITLRSSAAYSSESSAHPLQRCFGIAKGLNIPHSPPNAYQNTCVCSFLGSLSWSIPAMPKVRSDPLEPTHPPTHLTEVRSFNKQLLTKSVYWSDWYRFQRTTLLSGYYTAITLIYFLHAGTWVLVLLWDELLHLGIYLAGIAFSEQLRSAFSIPL